MSFSLDPEVASALAAGDDPAQPPAPGDWQRIRDDVCTSYTALRQLVPDRPEVRRSDHTATTLDGSTAALRWFVPPHCRPGPAVVHAHGGGMVAGSVDLFAPFVAEYAALSGLPILSVDYPLAPQAQGTEPVEHVLAAVNWLRDGAEALGVDPRRIALLGESAGGGLVASAAVLARERGIDVSGQVLVYPMLDDRTTAPDPLLTPFVTWPYSSNETGWRARLGDLAGSDEVGPENAPARLTDFAGLPPAYLEVGELDAFRDETVQYARGLWAAGVSAELHVLPGLPHGFDHAALTAQPTLRAKATRIHALLRLTDSPNFEDLT